MNVQPHRPARSVALLLAIALLAACDGSADETDQPSPTELPVPTPTASASPSAPAVPTRPVGEEASAFDLEPGDCFSAGGETIDTVTVISCERPHRYEAFAVLDHDAGADAPYPGDTAMLEYADARCQPLFEQYVATDYQTSIYWITSVTPSEDTWSQRGDREIVCTLRLGEEGEETTGSARGSGE